MARNPCSYLNRRLQIAISLAVTVILFIITLGTTTRTELVEKVPYGPQFQRGAHRAVEEAQHAVHDINPFSTPAHKPPPEQANSSSEGSRWYSDWKWRNQFSSSVTLDEDRAVLPPLANRPPIYTYYDLSSRRKDEKSRKAEQDLVHIWRRAWWAQGFRPVVLSKSEAMNNPLFRTIQGMELENALENELMRWLAWEYMGTGILANFLALPMAAHDDPMLSFLRRGEYPALTQYEGLETGLYVGSKEHIAAALKEAIKSPALRHVKLLPEALSSNTITVDTQHNAIAFYSQNTIKAKYGLIGEKFEELSTVSDGLAML